MRVKKWAGLLIVLALVVGLMACGTEQTASDSFPDSETVQDSSTQTMIPISSAEPAEQAETSAETDQADLEKWINDMGETAVEKTLHLLIGDKEVSVEWEDNESIGALIDLAEAGPLKIEMSMYGGFEQVGSLGAGLPRKDEETTTEAGDIVLYSGNRIVVFYGSNTWAYTRLGRITDKTPAEMADLLGNGNVSITISYE